ncbi:DNA-binding protein [Microbacterium sp. TS-1]|jgi:hypothetical protein|uniref:DNA-binding protein n=1 Tax=Microbacterium paludicola TaxID=300019 RepID=A0ABU1I4Q6_9MICO|nr:MULTISPECIES: hypothetical protein [Microbacterium]MDR6168705.1 hypothetical protein [Microbacterium paludicola]GAD33796.1 DNA-binding protein [Microbacterium sp. TS-1]
MSGQADEIDSSVSDSATQDAPETGRGGTRATSAGTGGDVTPPKEDTPVSPPGVQDGPALSMHDTTEQERLDGLVAQLRADLPGENRATVEKYVRQRVSEVGLNVGDDEIARIVDDLAAD